MSGSLSDVGHDDVRRPETDGQKLARYEDLRSCANRLLWTIHLQVTRIRQFDAGATEFVLQPVSDAEFLILSIDRFAAVARQIDDLTEGTISSSLDRLDAAAPNLKRARNVVAHIDNYLRGEGHDSSVRVGALSTHIFNESQMSFGGFDFDLCALMGAADGVFSAIQENPLWPSAPDRVG